MVNQLDMFGQGPKVYNRRKGSRFKPPPDAVYVGRPTKWGNPFELKDESQRTELLRRYEAWLLTQPQLMESMRTELKGKDLVCWCAPKPCHADVILRIANPVK